MASYDLTGNNPEFLSENNLFVVFKTTQRLEFHLPVFSNSLVVYREKLDLTGWDIIPINTSWVIDLVEDIDDAGRSDALLQDNAFNQQLVKSITITGGDNTNRRWRVDYQQFVIPASELDYGNVGPEPTPGLMKDFDQKIDFLLTTNDPLNSVSSASIDGITILDEDPTGVNPENLITDEVHNVNVPANKSVMRPTAGSFFEHDVVVTNVGTNTILVRDVDYVFVGLNKPKIRTSEHPSSIYEYIMLISPIVGDVSVTYRAWGGEVTQKDINAIRETLIAITTYLTNSNIITTGNITSVPTIIQMLDRIATIEDEIRHFDSAEHRIVATTTARHWFSIAELYRDNWSPDVLESTHANLTIQSESLGWVFDTHLSINLLRNYEKLRLDVDSSLNRGMAFELGNYDDYTNDIIPQLRIVWKEDGGTGELSGAVIQVGIFLESNDVETLSVYDKSGNSSYMEIYPNIPGTAPVIDNNIPLPNEDIWVDGNLDTQVDRTIITPKEGWLVFGGATPLHTLTTETEVGHLLESEVFPIDRIKKVTFYIYDRIEDKYIVKTGEHAVRGNEDISEDLLFFPGDLCSIKYELDHNGGDTKVRLTANLGSHSDVNQRFDLIQVLAFA